LPVGVRGRRLPFLALLVPLRLLLLLLLLDFRAIGASRSWACNVHQLSGL
jgi:hypothetical protein